MAKAFATAGWRAYRGATMLVELRYNRLVGRKRSTAIALLSPNPDD